MSRRRLRTFTLWTGSLLCVLIAAAFVVSAWWWMAVEVRGGGPFIGIYAGAINYSQSPVLGGTGVRRNWTGLRFALLGRTTSSGFTLPLIYPFAAVAIPTLLASRFWPKPPKPGHCRCGYDLRGNESGVCPECGNEVHA